MRRHTIPVRYFKKGDVAIFGTPCSIKNRENPVPTSVCRHTGSLHAALQQHVRENTQTGATLTNPGRMENAGQRDRRADLFTKSRQRSTGNRFRRLRGEAAYFFEAINYFFLFFQFLRQLFSTLVFIGFDAFVQKTFATTHHFGFIPVDTKYLCDVVLVEFERHNDPHLAERLQQNEQREGYGNNVFHVLKLLQK